MNTKILKAVAASALVATMATTPAMAEDTQFGVGVAVAGQNSTTIRGTVSLENNLRLEPYVGVSYTDNSGTSSTNFALGAALHVMKPVNSKINAYFGGFAGIDTSSSDYTVGNTTVSTSTTDFNFGPVAGVEYAFDRQFTLGAEVRAYLGFGDVTRVGTDSAVLVRYYF